jgi:hypothetical protein
MFGKIGFEAITVILVNGCRQVIQKRPDCESLTFNDSKKI